MPNVVPRGLFARDAEAWKNPPAIFARVAGVWKKVHFVYAMQAGAWQLIWGSDPVVPASASAAWLNPHSIRVTIVPPVVNTNVSWIVRRSDASIVATVPVGTLTVDDPTPLLASIAVGNKTLPAYTVEGYDGVTSSARASTNTVTWNLDAATITTSVTYPTATTATVTVNWTPNATYGVPDGWKAWRSDGIFFPSGTVLAASATSYDVSAQARGVALNFRAIPFALTAAGAYVQAGNAVNVVANSKAVTPVSLVLTATSSPLSNLRLTWASGGGTVTAYEVETSPNGTTWTASADDTSPSDWSTIVAGYMRVRATSPGGVSDWAQAGPVTPILDTVGPVASNITSFKPESSYGRMVVRGTWSSSSDTKTGQIMVKVGAGSYVSVFGPATITPSAVFSAVTNTASAGQVVTVLVRTWDLTGNVGTDDTAAYTLTASPVIVDPSGDKSGTWRIDHWRNDGTRATTEIATGWTSSGHNIGCFFYGTTIFPALGTKAIVSATVEYYRENAGGLGAAVQPLFWTHSLLTRSAEPVPDNEGVAEASRLGQGVIRSTPVDTGTFTLPTAFIAAFQGAAARGLCMYRGYVGVGDPDNYYELLGIGAVSASGVVNGRLKFNHLG